MHALLSKAAEEGIELGKLGTLLACPPDSPLSPQRMGPERARRKNYRGRSIWGALLATVAGGAVTVGALVYLDRIPASWWSDGMVWVKSLVHR